MVGLEPTSLAAHAPEACVFANFTTSAREPNFYQPISSEFLHTIRLNHCNDQKD